MKSKEEVVHDYRVRSIQDATMRVIARRGMSSATMQEIAEEAGVAKGTIYLYFRDRDELVEKTFESSISELHRDVDSTLAGDAPFDEKLRAMLRAGFTFFRENREFFRLYMSMRFPEGSPQQQRRQKRTCQPQYQTRIDRMAEALTEAMKRGEVRECDARRLALLIFEATNALIIERVMEEESPSEESDIELLVTTILNGISLQKGRRSSH